MPEQIHIPEPDGNQSGSAQSSYEPPALEDLVSTEGPSVTAALATNTIAAPRDV
jgi:hypothetical protein